MKRSLSQSLQVRLTVATLVLCGVGASGCTETAPSTGGPSGGSAGEGGTVNGGSAGEGGTVTGGSAGVGFGGSAGMAIGGSAGNGGAGGNAGSAAGGGAGIGGDASGGISGTGGIGGAGGIGGTAGTGGVAGGGGTGGTGGTPLGWIRQFGTPEYDGAEALALAPDGGVYVAGVTHGDLGAGAQLSDGFVRKYTSGGEVSWTRQFGTAGSDVAYAVTVAGDGSVYVAGVTGGDLAGTGLTATHDGFLRKYTADGSVSWTTQFGTSGVTQCSGVAVASDGSVYVTGYSQLDVGGSAGHEDAFVRKYSAVGSLDWVREFGTSSNDHGRGVAVGIDGGVYVTGHTGGDLAGTGSAGGADVFLRKYTAGGSISWTQQFGTASLDMSYSVAAAADGSVYISGITDGALTASSGGRDAFLRKYSASGVSAWVRQFGTSGVDLAWSVTTSGGVIYLVGQTTGDLAGTGRAGSYDAFVRSYAPSGDALWTAQIGTPSSDGARAIAVASDGAVYFAGETAGDLAGSGSAGYLDAFVVRHEP